jgi:hypothetical protein
MNAVCVFVRKFMCLCNMCVTRMNAVCVCVCLSQYVCVTDVRRAHAR